MSAGFLSRLRRKLLLDRAGYGRPLSQEVLDREYRDGAWAHFQQPAELPRQLLVAGLAGTLHPEPRVLDVGCGSGLMARLLQPHRPRRYLGIDVSGEGLKLARALGVPGAEFVAADFENWTTTERFDVIILSECVGYARDPGALIAGLLPSLAPEGRLIVSYYRSGHWEALWGRILAVVRSESHTTVSNPQGQTWDIRTLRDPQSRESRSP